MPNKIFAFILFVLSISSCTTTEKPVDFVDQAEQAHQKSNFLKHETIQFDIKLSFGGKERLNGTMTLQTNSSKGKLSLNDSTTILFVNDKVYSSPNSENLKGKRFDAYTWSYFFLFPYKLSDGGTQWSEYEKKELNGKVYDVEKLTFTAGTGDAPDDWYIVYANKENHLIDVAAYIVTAGKSQEKAEEDPHAIQYENYEAIDDVPIATKWKFWAWRTNKGLTKQLGDADLTNMAFVNVAEDFFTPPADFIEVQ
jgi:hypothetical protein